MLDTSQPVTQSGPSIRVGVVSTFPPTRCGIGRFASSFVDALSTADRDLEVEVVRLVSGPDDSPAHEPVVMQIDPNNPVGIRAARRHLERCDVAIFQHEFGIYGDNDGRAVIDLLDGLQIPKISVLHTVVPEPTQGQRSIIQFLARESTIVALCRSAASLLADRYGVRESSVEVISHGAQWPPQPVNHDPRRRLITWGLLGPGKGLERAIEAVAMLRDIDPPISYRIVGRTHPLVAARHGYGYRESLEALVSDLGLDGVVDFVDRYVDDRELFQMARRSDVVVVPYDNHDQVSSGVITEAVGLGRPVVATRFPYSEELLGSGAGSVVDHDPEAIALAVRRLVEDSVSYRRAAREAARQSQGLSWSQVADSYSSLLRDLVPVVATA